MDCLLLALFSGMFGGLFMVLQPLLRAEREIAELAVCIHVSMSRAVASSLDVKNSYVQY
jgi:hypothetical protein